MTRNEAPFRDDFGRRLLDRAAQIDATLTSPTQLTELRQAALEAGIHPTAFDAALRELSASHPPARRSRWEVMRQNLLAAGAFWVTMSAIVQPLIWLDLPAPSRSLGILIAGFAGIQMADRLRARLVRTGLIAINAGQAVLFAFDLMGITATGANVLTWAVFFTGILATVTAAVYGSKDRSSRLPSGSVPADSHDSGTKGSAWYRTLDSSALPSWPMAHPKRP